MAARRIVVVIVGLAIGALAWLVPAAPAVAGCPIFQPDCGTHVYHFSSQLSVDRSAGTVVIAGTGGPVVTCPSTCTRTDTLTVADDAGRPTEGWPGYTLTATAGPAGFDPQWSGCASVSGATCTVVNDAPSKTVTLDWVDRTDPVVTFDPPARVGPLHWAVTASATDTSGVISSYRWSVDHGEFVPGASSLGLQYLPAGSHTIAVAAVDGAGRWSSTASAVVVVDKSVGLTVSPVADYVSAAPSLTISTDPDVVERTCQVDGGGYAACTSPWSPSLTDGSHTLDVQVGDDVGNVATQSRTFVLDSTAPVLSLTDGPSEGAVLSQTSTGVTVHQVDANPDALDCTLDGAPLGCSADVPVPLAGLSVGAHQLTVTATDKAGNTGTLTRHFTVHAAPVPPPAKARPITTLHGPARATAGTRAVFRLLLSPPAGVRGVPTGVVTWRTDGKRTCRTPLRAGRATCRTGRLTPGRHVLVASYAGSGAFLATTLRAVVRVRR